MKRKFKSAKDILFRQDLLAQRAQSAKYMHHEFQDFAYRLANDLGDLEHRAIYMRLAKAYPRFMLERALSLVKDSNQINRGPLFMWQLKKLREERSNNDFSLANVFQRMRIYADAMSNDTWRKCRSGLDLPGSDVFSKFTNLLPTVGSKKMNTVIYDSHAGMLSSLLPGDKAHKFKHWEISLHLAKKMRNDLKIQVSTGIKTVTNIKPDAKTDVIWLGRIWQIIPFEGEATQLKIFHNAMADGGLLVIKCKHAEVAKQQWQFLERNGQQLPYLIKQQPHEITLQTISENGFKLLTEVENYLVLEKLKA